MMGKRLAGRHVKPDRVVSSPAARALTTAQLIAAEIGYERKAIVIDDRLYASSADALLDVIRALDAKLDCVMLVGHNPEFSELAHRLSGDLVDMPTSAVAELNFDTRKWADVGHVAPARAALDYPKK